MFVLCYTQVLLLCRFAFLEFEEEVAAEDAIKQDQMELDGRTLKVSYAQPKGSGGGGGGGRDRRSGGGH